MKLLKLSSLTDATESADDLALYESSKLRAPPFMRCLDRRHLVADDATVTYPAEDQAERRGSSVKVRFLSTIHGNGM